MTDPSQEAPKHHGRKRIPPAGFNFARDVIGKLKCQRGPHETDVATFTAYRSTDRRLKVVRCPTCTTTDINVNGERVNSIAWIETGKSDAASIGREPRARAPRQKRVRAQAEPEPESSAQTGTPFPLPQWRAEPLPDGTTMEPVTDATSTAAGPPAEIHPASTPAQAPTQARAAAPPMPSPPSVLAPPPAEGFPSPAAFAAIDPRAAGKAYGVLVRSMVPLYEPLVVGMARNPDAAAKAFSRIDYAAMEQAFAGLAERHPALLKGLIADLMQGVAAFGAPFVFPLIAGFASKKKETVEPHYVETQAGTAQLDRAWLESALKESAADRARLDHSFREATVSVRDLLSNVKTSMDTIKERMDKMERESASRPSESERAHSSGTGTYVGLSTTERGPPLARTAALSSPVPKKEAETHASVVITNGKHLPTDDILAKDEKCRVCGGNPGMRPERRVMHYREHHSLEIDQRDKKEVTK